MNTLVNVFHPDLEASAVNATWIETLRQSGDVTINLQYTNYPDWSFDVAREQQLLVEHDVIVLQFPFLWYSVPPLMKKWFDDILTYGLAYGTEGEALKGKKAILAISTGCAESTYRTGGDNNYSMQDLLKPIQQTLELTQMDYAAPFVFHGAGGASQRDIDKSAASYLSHVTTFEQSVSREQI